MATEDHDLSPTTPADATPGLSRRGLLRNAAGLGAAGLAAGLLVDVSGAPASAAQSSTSTADHAPVTAGGPLVAHVHDASTGEVDLFAGDQQVRVHNPALARALAHALATGI